MEVIVSWFLKSTETVLVIYRVIDNYWKFICDSYSRITSTHKRVIKKSTQLITDR